MGGWVGGWQGGGGGGGVLGRSPPLLLRRAHHLDTRLRAPLPPPPLLKPPRTPHRVPPPHTHPPTHTLSSNHAGASTSELMQIGRTQIKETDASLLRSEKVLNDTMAIGIQTAETLQGQTRQLEKVRVCVCWCVRARRLLAFLPACPPRSPAHAHAPPPPLPPPR